MPIGRWIPVVLLVMILGACDDGDQPAFDDSAVRQDLAAVYAGDHPTDAALRDGACFAGRFLDATTPSSLRAAGVVGADGTVTDTIPPLDRSTAEAWADAQMACTDFVAASSRALSLVKEGRLDATTYGRCLRAALDHAAIRAALVASLMGRMDSPAVTVLAQAQSTCASRSVRR